jgi:hypothetical protein
MTIGERVIDTVVDWSGIDDFLTTDPLANIWARSSSSTAIPFKDQAVTDLIGALRQAFRPPFVPSRNLSSLKPGDFAPPAGINTVDDLEAEVMAAPPGQSVAALAKGKKKPKKTSSARAEGSRSNRSKETK